MVDRGRGHSPGAKGTAYPHAQRPQKSGPPAGAKPRPAGQPSGKPFAGRPGGAAKSGGTAAGKPGAPARPGASDHLQKKAAPAAATEPGAVPAGVRVSKLLAERGLCSRREADEYIAKGWVFVDGERVTELGVRAAPDAEITLAPAARSKQDERVTILLHKPVGYVSGLPEDGHQPAVVLVRADTQQRGPADAPFRPVHLKGLAPAGRLDIDSTGLLVLTQDGRVARQLIGDDSEADKEYLVRVEGTLAEGGIERLRHGLELDGKPLRPARVEWLNEDQLRFVLREGRKRQIRRMCELVGLKVVGLKRVRIGGVRLGDLPPGKWRFLRPDERF